MGCVSLFDCHGLPFSSIRAEHHADLAVPGVYLFVRKGESGRHQVLYVGEGEDLAAILGPRHPCWRTASALGMTEIHVHLLAISRRERHDIKAFLEKAFDPPFNRKGFESLA